MNTQNSTTTAQLSIEIQEAIDRHLSSQIGSALKERLKKADLDATECARLRDALDAQTKNYGAEVDKVEELRDALKAHEDISSRMLDLERRERDLQLTILKAELASERRITEVISGALAGLVRNVEFRSSVFKSDSVAIPNGHYMTQNSSTGTNTQQAA